MTTMSENLQFSSRFLQLRKEREREKTPHPTLCFSLGAVWYLFLLVGSDATLGK